jgi:hypothetical protein
LVDNIATISKAEVLQTADSDATNGGRICFQRCIVLLLAGTVIFLDFAAISMDFAETLRFLLHFYIIFTTADLMFCYSSRKLLLQRL